MSGKSKVIHQSKFFGGRSGAVGFRFMHATCQSLSQFAFKMARSKSSLSTLSNGSSKQKRYVVDAKQQKRYVVEAVLRKRDADGRVLVKWAGYKTTSWEPAKYLMHTRAYKLFKLSEEDSAQDSRAVKQRELTSVAMPGKAYRMQPLTHKNCVRAHMMQIKSSYDREARISC